MRIFSEDKKTELFNIDESKYKLVKDKISIHHDEVKEVKQVSHYEVIKEYPNGGKDVKEIIDAEGVDYVAPYDSEEEVLIAKLKTADELKEEKISSLRIQRNNLLTAFDIYKSNVNYGLISEDASRHQIIKDWYTKILDITKSLDESLITNHPAELDKYL